MNTLQDILKFQIQQVEKLRSIFESYRDKIEFLHFSGTHPYKAEILMENLTQLAKNIRKAKKKLAGIIIHDPKTLTEDVLEYSSAIDYSHFLLKEMYDIYNENRVQIYGISSSSSESSLSQTYVEDLAKQLEQVLSTFIQYHHNYIIQIDYINHLLVEHTMKYISSLTNIIENGYKYYKKNEMSLKIYSHFLRRLVNEPSLEARIIQIREEMKNITLQITLPIPKKQTNYNIIQQLIQINQLVPDAPSEPLSKVLHKLFPTADFKSDMNFNQISQLLSNGQNYGFVVFNKIFPNPLENNIWSLIDFSFLKQNNLITSYVEGINEKNIQKLETIHLTTHDLKKSRTPKNFVQIYNQSFTNKGPNYYYILETLDGSNYRILTPWYVNKNNPRYAVPQQQFSLENFPSTRFEHYNHHLGKAILKHVKEPRVHIEVDTDINWVKYRSDIFKYIFDLFSEHLQNINQLSESNFKKIFEHSIIIDGFFTIISTSSSIIGPILEASDSPIEGPSDDLVRSELIISYISDLERLTKKFKFELLANYKQYEKQVKKILPPNQSKKQTPLINKQLLDIFENVLKETLKTLVNEKGHVFNKILHKMNIISNTFSL